MFNHCLNISCELKNVLVSLTLCLDVGFLRKIPFHYRLYKFSVHSFLFHFTFFTKFLYPNIAEIFNLGVEFNVLG